MSIAAEREYDAHVEAGSPHWGPGLLRVALIIVAFLAVGGALVMGLRLVEDEGIAGLAGRLPGRRIDQNPVLWLTFMLTKALAATTGLLAIGIVVVRMRLAWVEARTERFFKAWRPRILAYILEQPVTLEPISRFDWPSFIVLWNHLHESMRGTARQRLNRLAVEVGMRDVARGYLERSDVRRKVLALLALGNLRDGHAWRAAREGVTSENPVLSAAALRCMLLLHPQNALPIVTPMIATRADWSPVRVAIFLQDAGTDLVGRYMSRAAEKAPPGEAVRLLKYMHAIGCEQVGPSVRRLVDAAADANLVAACVPMLREHEDLPRVRALLGHPSWFVRLQACVALGRLGEPEDEPTLIGLLSDSQWWVRYRAAQALIALPGLGDAGGRRVLASLTDRYARDILRQALSEAYPRQDFTITFVDAAGTTESVEAPSGTAPPS